MGYAVLTEAALGFVGVGIQPPTPTWGNMLQQAFPMLEQQPLLSIVPGVAIFLLVLSFIQLRRRCAAGFAGSAAAGGDSLRGAGHRTWDPKSHCRKGQVNPRTA